MSCACQHVCETGRDDFDRAFPDRHKESDGCCASAQHTAQNPTSGHEAGIALDVDADLEPGNPARMQEVANSIAAAMLAGLLPQIDYIIFNRRIFNPEIAPFWRPYHGSNSHVTHIHIEFYWSFRNSELHVLISTEGTFTVDQFKVLDGKLDKLIEITAKRGALARLNARVKSVLKGETRRTERNAVGRR